MLLWISLVMLFVLWIILDGTIHKAVEREGDFHSFGKGNMGIFKTGELK